MKIRRVWECLGNDFNFPYVNKYAISLGMKVLLFRQTDIDLFQIILERNKPVLLYSNKFSQALQSSFAT